MCHDKHCYCNVGTWTLAPSPLLVATGFIYSWLFNPYQAGQHRLPEDRVRHSEASCVSAVGQQVFLCPRTGSAVLGWFPAEAAAQVQHIPVGSARLPGDRVRHSETLCVSAVGQQVFCARGQGPPYWDGSCGLCAGVGSPLEVSAKFRPLVASPTSGWGHVCARTHAHGACARPWVRPEMNGLASLGEFSR